MKRLKRRILAGLLAFVMCFSTVNVTAFAEDNQTSSEVQEVIATNEAGGENESPTENIVITDASVSGNNIEPAEENLLNENQEQVTNEKIYESENYNVIFSLTSSWENGYNANVKIENTGDDTIQNWYLSFKYDEQITNIWNAEISTHEENQYIVKNAGWNQDIVAGGSIEFGISGSTAFNEFPENFNIVGENKEVREEDYSVQYQVDSDWGSGFTGSIQITNNTDKTLEDWVLEFDFERKITNIWNAVIESHEGNHYVIRNAGYNANITAGQSVLFGFNGHGGSANNVAENCVLYSWEIDTTEYVELSDGKIEKNYLERAIYTNLLLQGLSIDNIRLADDYDEDGLTLSQEYEYDTNPFSKDTDEDGLNDYEEINLHKTNPIKYDSDEDGMSDGTEIACGLNPLSSDTDGNGVIDSQEIVTQAVRIDTVEQYQLQEVGTLPNIQITGKGDYSQKIYATALENDATIMDIDCLVGTAFDFIHDEDLSFENSQLTFTISNEILKKNKLTDLAIAWYNEEENALELLDTTHNMDNCTISAEVSHYSTYMVVSVPDYFFNIDWENEDSIIEAGKADVVFVIDTTGSMGNEIQNVKNNIETVVSSLEENKVDIRLGLVEYRDIYADGIGSTKSYDWYTSVSSFKSELATLGVSGGGDTPESVVDALYCARNMEYRTGVKKYVILLTDANYKNGTSVDSGATLTDEIRRLVEEELVVSVVTTPSYYSTYNSLVSQTDGVTANINQNFASALAPLITKMGEQVNQGCWIRLSNGSVVSLDKDPTLGDETIDTDDDGIPDIIELKSSYKVHAYNPYTKKMQEIDTWSFYSNPSKRDTDGDTLSDIDDLQPTKYDTVVIKENDSSIAFNTGRTWYNISCTSFDYLDNLMQMVDGKVDNPIPIEQFRQIIQNVANNEKQAFTIEELTYIAIMNNEGSKLYMHNLSSVTRENVFQKIAGRESRYYKHSGIWWNENWSEVPKGTESGFFKGTVLSEADINLSWEIYCVCDVYTVLTTVAQVGALVIAIVVVAEVTPVVLANIQGLAYYVKTFGIVQGIQMYRYLGIQNLPNGVISWLQMDMADGDSSVDDVALAIQKESVEKKLDTYLLNKDHPVGGSKANWFEKALGFTKENAGQLAKQIVFDENVAVQTAVTEHGIKYNQLISIVGANGKKIDVVFVWIKNNDGFVRLVTAIPTKK